MTQTLDQQLHERAQKYFADNNIQVTPENKDALFEMYKAHDIAGSEIERTHDYLRSKVEDFYHPDRERANIKANAAIAMLANAVNGTSVMRNVFHQMFQFNTGHRLLDANVINELFYLIKFIAEDDKVYVEGRNQYAVQLCKDLMKPMQS